MKILDNAINYIRYKTLNIKQWGTERATLELLGESDKKWVELRYQIASRYINDGFKVLDAATGSGFGAKELSKCGASVVGVDISKDAVVYARHKYGDENTSYYVGDVTSLKFCDNEFDAAVGIETIEHIPEYVQYLSELKRVVKENGKIIISTPQKKAEIPNTPFHVHEFYYDEFIKVLQSLFIVREVYGLKRQSKPCAEKVSYNNYSDYDIYLAVCENCKMQYETSDTYNDDYYVSEENGYKMNYCGRLFAKALAENIRGKKVLSIGCATGIVEDEIKSLNDNLNITGTDITDTDTLRVLRSKNTGLDKFVLVDADTSFKQPFASEEFDTVYSAHVLEHIPFPKILIKESIRLTRDIAMHMTPVNLMAPGHINFFRWGNYDNPYRLQESNADLKAILDDVVEEMRVDYPNLEYEMKLVCSRQDTFYKYPEKLFQIKRGDRPDGLLESFLVVIYKYGKKT